MAEEQAQDSLNVKALEALENVIDPELGIDIVNLGLIYGLDVDEENNVKVTMTLTTMGCPLGATIESDVKRAISMLDEINDAEVNIVWHPPWSIDKISRYGKIALGLP